MKKYYQITQQIIIEANNKAEARRKFYELDINEMDIRPKVEERKENTLTKKQKKMIVLIIKVISFG